MHQSIVTMPDHLQESLSYLKKRISARPVVAVILGSGLGDFANHLKKRIVISVEDVPFYPHLTIEGHSGNIIFGTLSDKEILVFQGRVHYYEEGDLSNVLYPIHIAHGLGIKKLLVTNAAGGINRQFRPGDLMLITDQINLTFENLHPRSPKGRLNKNAPGKRYQTYDTKLQSILWEVALSKGISLRCGVYCGVKGPSYETAAEIEMIRRIGGDAVGMSTVHEASLAVNLGMQVAGISCITNLATGILDGKLSHAEVTEVAHFVKKSFTDLLTGFIERLS